MARDSHLRKVLGAEKLSQIQKSKVLLVGAGGIGCELLKDLVMMNYGEIHIVDLDTIDLSNLNRQFLFRQKDIKKSKSSTALKAVEYFNNDNTKMSSYIGSIMDSTQFPLSWFEQFDIIFNALDNIEARTYVNRIALFLKKPLLESGTTGFKGQVQPIYPYESECFECVAKETPKTFPVCTIRSTPSKPIHSITWAKNFLFAQLFGEEVEELKPSDVNSDNQEEVETLIKESNELLDLKKLIVTAAPDNDGNLGYIYQIIDHIFKADIERLLKVDTLWKTRAKPTPLNYRDYSQSLSYDNDDQKLWTTDENLAVLVDSTKRLTKRYQITRQGIPFDKDDVDTLDFVVATSNLRSFIFDIPLKTKFDVKQIAGNIIPAISTTNAIIAGFSALQSLNCFEKDSKNNSQMIFTSDYTDKFISSFKIAPAKETCKSCSIPRGVLKIGSNFVLQDLIDNLKKKYQYEEVSVILGKNRLIYDYDFDDNADKMVSTLGFFDGEIMLINDEDDVLETSEFYIRIMKEDEGLELPEIDIPAKKVPSAKDSADEQEAEEKDGGDEITTNDVNGDEEIILIEDDEEIVALVADTEEPASAKRKLEDGDNGEEDSVDDIHGTPFKKIRLKDDSTVEETVEIID